MLEKAEHDAVEHARRMHLKAYKDKKAAGSPQTLLNYCLKNGVTLATMNWLIEQIEGNLK